MCRHFQQLLAIVGLDIGRLDCC